MTPIRYPLNAGCRAQSTERIAKKREKHMPEGHMIHRMARDHQALFEGERVTLTSPQGRFREGAEALSGATFSSAFAHGKHLFHHYTLEDHSRGNPRGGPEAFVHIHLGLYGKFKRRALEDESIVSPNCRLRIQSEREILDLAGPTCCEVLDEEGVKRKRSQLGPDPLRSDGDVELFIQRLSKRRIPIAAALLNQSVIAGLGNIYRAELLFKHKINPMTPAHAVKETTARALWDTAVWWLALGVETDRIITTLELDTRAGGPLNLKNHLKDNLKALPRRESFMVYGHEACPRCHGAIEVSAVGGRKLYACPSCQVEA